MAKPGRPDRLGRMKPLIALLTQVTVIASLVQADEPMPFPGDDALYFYSANLVRVVDGHTVVLDIDLGFFTWHRFTTIRLAGIDAPEAQTAEGKAAAEWLRERLEEASELGKLRIRTVKGDEKRDLSGSYGAWHGVLFADGVNVNGEMVAKGLARAKAGNP